MPLTAALEKKIHEEVTGGLSTDRERRDDALKNLHFYNGNFKAYKPKTTNTSGDDIRPRYSLLMQRIVKTLCANLYKAGPKRSILEHKEASAWLEWIYRCNAMDAMFQRADICATWGDWCAFQVRPIKDPLRPLDVQLWDSSQLYIWCDPEDQRVPVAVGTRDAFNEQSRLQVWTAETITTYMTAELQKGPKGQTSGGVAFEFRNRKDNPLGVLPFSFVHFDMPIQEFDTTGPGDFLSCANENANSILTNIGGAITYNLWPVVTVANAPPGWVPPTPHKPGQVWFSNSDPANEGQGASMEIKYLQADPSFVAAGWDDLSEYFNHTMEMCGVPRAAIRMEQTSTQSGAAIIAEQIPLILWAQSRQEPFANYERKFAQLVMTIGAGHLGSQQVDEYKVTAAQLEEAAYDTQLMLRWPSLYPRIPGPELDVSDTFRLNNRQTSPTLLLMERDNLTREEAEEKEEEIAKDWQRWAKLFPDVEPENPAPGQNAEKQEADKAKEQADAKEKADADAEAKTESDESSDKPDKTT